MVFLPKGSPPSEQEPKFLLTIIVYHFANFLVKIVTMVYLYLV